MAHRFLLLGILFTLVSWRKLKEHKRPMADGGNQCEVKAGRKMWRLNGNGCWSPGLEVVCSLCGSDTKNFGFSRVNFTPSGEVAAKDLVASLYSPQSSPDRPGKRENLLLSPLTQTACSKICNSRGRSGNI